MEPGWHDFIGFDNFRAVITDPSGLRGPLFQVFIWTVVFAALSVVLSLALGMLSQWRSTMSGYGERSHIDRC